MDEKIFRKKSLDKVKSPESLDDYIRVSNPGVWLLLISVIILLAGACIWGIFGHVDSTVPATVQVKNNQAVCYILDENISCVKVGLTVKFEDEEAIIATIGEKSEDGYPCTFSKSVALPDGFYNAEVVTKSYKPLSFILN